MHLISAFYLLQNHLYGLLFTSFAGPLFLTTKQCFHFSEEWILILNLLSFFHKKTYMDARRNLH